MISLSALCVSLAVLQTPQQAVHPWGAGTAEIRGRVTDGETGAPLARAGVDLARVGSREGSIRTVTDAAGRFRIAGLPPGEYQGIVQPGQFRATNLSQPLRSNGQEPFIKLADGEIREINVSMPRTYTIAVRVVDPWGDPLSGLRVVAIKKPGRRSTSSFRHATDDLGRLRLFGLEPGRYSLCVEIDSVGFFRDSASRRESLLPTCYPSNDEQTAELVQLDKSEAGEFEIRMRYGRTYSISGRIVDAAGAPARSAHLGLMTYVSGGSSGRGVHVDEEGQFVISNAQSGEYALQASLGGPDRPEARRPLESAFLPVVVTADVDGVVLQLNKTIDVAGRVLLDDPSATLPESPGSGLIVSSRLAEDRLAGYGSTQSAIVRRDRLFTLSGVYGRRTLEIRNVPRGWFVKSIRYGDEEVIDTAVEFKDGGPSQTMDILLSNRGATIEGRVLDEGGKPVASAVVLMFRADGGATPRTAAAVGNVTSGRPFRLGPVRPGNYRVIAISTSTEPLQEGDWVLIEKLIAAGERITLSDFEARTLDLQLFYER